MGIKVNRKDDLDKMFASLTGSSNDKDLIGNNSDKERNRFLKRSTKNKPTHLKNPILPQDKTKK